MRKLGVNRNVYIEFRILESFYHRFAVGTNPARQAGFWVQLVGYPNWGGAEAY
jgi:hypothetical protein